MHQAKLLALFQNSMWIIWIFVFYFVALNSSNEIQVGLMYVTHLMMQVLQGKAYEHYLATVSIFLIVLFYKKKLREFETRKRTTMFKYIKQF